MRSLPVFFLMSSRLASQQTSWLVCKITRRGIYEFCVNLSHWIIDRDTLVKSPLETSLLWRDCPAIETLPRTEGQTRRHVCWFADNSLITLNDRLITPTEASRCQTGQHDGQGYSDEETSSPAFLSGKACLPKWLQIIFFSSSQTVRQCIHKVLLEMVCKLLSYDDVIPPKKTPNECTCLLIGSFSLSLGRARHQRPGVWLHCQGILEDVTRQPCKEEQ